MFKGRAVAGEAQMGIYSAHNVTGSLLGPGSDLGVMSAADSVSLGCIRAEMNPVFVVASRLVLFQLLMLHVCTVSVPVGVLSLL